ncbi:hypothetical protein [Streptomyces sp. AGS-58]
MRTGDNRHDVPQLRLLDAMGPIRAGGKPHRAPERVLLGGGIASA